MVISQPQGIILHIIIVLHQRLSVLWMLPERHLMFYTCNYNIRVTLKCTLLSIFFTRIRSTEGHQPDCSLFILSLHALALHLAVKILLQIFLYEDLSTLTLTYIVSCIPSRIPSRTALCYATNTIKWSILIFDINHQQNTRRSDQIETINDNANYAPSYPCMSFTNGSGCHF